MIDLIYLAHNRLEFTKASLAALEANTNWNLVDRFVIYDDQSTDGTREYLQEWILTRTAAPHCVIPRFGTFGHPVNVMRDYLLFLQNHSIFAKIDSDTMVPPGWLDQALDVMDRHPELDLLGIEAMNELDARPQRREYTDARFIGGIGLIRTEAFNFSLPNPIGAYHGFTEWQELNGRLKKGWISPALPVFLLDRLPREPWRTLSAEYVEKFGQRDWGPYDRDSRQLWSWWCD